MTLECLRREKGITRNDTIVSFERRLYTRLTKEAL